MHESSDEFEFRPDRTKGCGVTALERCQKLVLLNILRMDGQNFTKFCIHIIIDKIYFAIVKRHFLANLQQSYSP